jgi:hypothetical protein
VFGVRRLWCLVAMLPWGFGLEVRLGGGVGELQWQCWRGMWCCRLFSGSGGDSKKWWRSLEFWCCVLAEVVVGSGGTWLRWWFG